MVEVEAVPVQIGDSELPQPPRLLFQRINDVCSWRFQLAVRGINIFCEHPVNRGFERRPSPPEEDHNVSPWHSPDLLVRIEPPDLEAESVSIVLLRSCDIRDRQFGHRLTHRGQGLFCAHKTLLTRHMLLIGAPPNGMRLSCRRRPPPAPRPLSLPRNLSAHKRHSSDNRGAVSFKRLLGGDPTGQWLDRSPSLRRSRHRLGPLWRLASRLGAACRVPVGSR